ncbi:hypoxanthine-guanine phosphoribosyltransferase-like protein, partial [Dinothrombium tinctorium]
GGYEFFNLLLENIRKIYRIRKFGETDYLTKHIRIEFVRITSYKNDKSTELEMCGINNMKTLEGKNVLAVEDVIDIGRSMAMFFEKLAQYKPKSSRLACLMLKKRKRGVFILSQTLSNFDGFPLDCFCIPDACKDDLDAVLIPGRLLKDRIERLAYDIARDYENEPFTAVCILRGGYEFFNLLLENIRKIYRILKFGETDYLTKHIRIEFVRITSYKNDKSTELE